MWQWTFKFYKMRGISWLPEEMIASQEGLCAMDIYICAEGMHISRGGRSLGRLNFVQVHLIFVGYQHGTWSTLPVWCLKFESSFQIFRKCVQRWVYVCIWTIKLGWIIRIACRSMRAISIIAKWKQIKARNTRKRTDQHYWDKRKLLCCLFECIPLYYWLHYIYSDLQSAFLTQWRLLSPTNFGLDNVAVDMGFVVHEVTLTSNSKEQSHGIPRIL